MRDRERTAAKTCQGIIGDFTQSRLRAAALLATAAPGLARLMCDRHTEFKPKRSPQTNTARIDNDKWIKLLTHRLFQTDSY